MEEEKSIDMPISSTGGSGTPSSSRWNPTKEQIGVLEGLYNQGIRTPSAEQIQQITSRLRAYGHIEGKNVFYWFQNHKARQRQKQKQESMVYFNRFLHKSTPILAPPCTNVVCGAYCIPHPPVGFYPQYPEVLLPGAMRRPIEEKVARKTKENLCEGYEAAHPVNDSMDAEGTMTHETLQLFPLHPTGILESRSEDPSPSTSTQTCNIKEGSVEETFINFWRNHESQ
ncbi:hypothetical protein AAC387_Pa03g2548 [Persea americana]